MKRLLSVLCLSVVLLTGCAATTTLIQDTREAIALCIQDTQCKAEVLDQGKKGASQGGLIGGAIPVPFGSAGGAALGALLMGGVALLKGGFGLLKKKKESN